MQKPTGNHVTNKPGRFRTLESKFAGPGAVADVCFPATLWCGCGIYIYTRPVLRCPVCSVGKPCFPLPHQPELSVEVKLHTATTRKPEQKKALETSHRQLPTMSGGFHKYRCKYFLSEYVCLNWVYVNGRACACCLVCLCFTVQQRPVGMS